MKKVLAFACLFTLPVAHAETAPAPVPAKPATPAPTTPAVKPATPTAPKPVAAPAPSMAPVTTTKPATPVAAPPVAPVATTPPAIVMPAQPAAPTALSLEQRHQQELLANAERIDKANRELLARNQEMQLKNENLDMQLNIIRHDKSSEGIWKGALAVIVGFLMGWFFATSSRRKSGW